MRILLTGASSFSGCWFAKTLSAAGHQVVATFRGAHESYEGIRAARVALLKGEIEACWGMEFGSPKFLDLVGNESFDLICHHASEMEGYRSWDFDTIKAVQKNTRSIRQILELGTSRSCKGVIYTGTVFEPYEGVGDEQRRAFNPYGLSKHVSFEVMRMEAARIGMPIGKFVIPNPFGPFEEARFTTYLAREWAADRVPKVGTPNYVRDNIHVSLLSVAYRQFCESFDPKVAVSKCAPCGYVESQGAFASRVAEELRSRSGRACHLEFAEQMDYSEPMFRTNSHHLRPSADWTAAMAWDALAAFYREMYGL